LTFCHDSVGKTSTTLRYRHNSPRLVDEHIVQLESTYRSATLSDHRTVGLTCVTDSSTETHVLTQFPHHFDPRDDNRAEQSIPYLISHTYLDLRRAYNHGILSYPDYKLLNQSAETLYHSLK
jgi:hypothetical protein